MSFCTEHCIYSLVDMGGVQGTPLPGLNFLYFHVVFGEKLFLLFIAKITVEIIYYCCTLLYIILPF